MSRLVWMYEGAEDEKHGEQVALVGDTVNDDVFGEGVPVRMDGSAIVIDFIEDDERVQKERTKGHVYMYALEQREHAQQKRTDLQKSAKDSTLEHSLFAAFNTD